MTALVVAAACSACATVAPIDRFMLRTEAQAVRVESGRGALSNAATRKVLDDIKKRAPETNILGRHVAVEEALAGNPLSLNNLALPLEDGKEAYASMLKSIRGARHHVHMEMYIFEDDEVGHEFALALAERAKAGVAVRLIYDAVGSMKTPKEFFERLEEAGVKVAVFNPVAAGLLKRGPVGVQARNHRKLLLVDGRVAVLGGINISRVYGSASSGGGRREAPDAPFEEQPWRDLQVRLEGPVVADFQRVFVAQWEKWKKETLAPAGLFPKLAPAGPHVVRAVASSPAGEGAADPLYLAAEFQARVAQVIAQGCL